MKLFKSFLVLIFLFGGIAFPQHDDWFYSDDFYADEGEPPMLEYDKYNPFAGGDSTRLCDGRYCNGNIIDQHPNGKIKHKGFYTRGKLRNGYENYFDTEQLERKFRILSGNSGVLDVYYSDGTLRSEVEFFKNQPLKWKDYYPNGNIEFWEEYDRKLEYYVRFNFYYINGTPQSILELKDLKKLTYDTKEHYLNGNIKEEGEMQYLPFSGGHVKVGEWKVYDIQGKLIRTEKYREGMIDTGKDDYDDLDDK